jgi:hypothetical protein
VALTLQSWWVLIGVLLVHALATIAVVAYTLQRASDTSGKLDPVTEARIEEEQRAETRDQRQTRDRREARGLAARA